MLLSLKEDPTSDDDFNIVLAPLFVQFGFGTFCWPFLRVPNGTAGVKDGAKATIQVRQGGHDSGWLYVVRFPRKQDIYISCLISNIFLFSVLQN